MEQDRDRKSDTEASPKADPTAPRARKGLVHTVHKTRGTEFWGGVAAEVTTAAVVTGTVTRWSLFFACLSLTVHDSPGRDGARPSVTLCFWGGARQIPQAA